MKHSLLALVFLRLVCSAEPNRTADFTDAGIAAGAQAPAFELIDQAGQKRTIASLMGPKGLILIFFRSADW